MADERRARRPPPALRLTAAAAVLAVAAAAAAALAGGARADFTASCPPPCECKWQSGNKAAACGGAGLEGVPERLSDDIQNLELSDNPLRRLPADAFRRAGLANLKKLVLRSCRLELVHRTAFAGLRIMIELDLSRNRLRALDADTFRETERLRWVNLAGNELAALPDELFRDLQYLQRVDASDNRLARVAAAALAGLPRLHTLRLDGNRLTRLRPDALRSLARLASLDLHGNPWRCDCELRPFRDWVLERNLYTAPTACAAPPALAGRLWSELGSASFACRPSVLEPPPDATIRARSDNVTLACKAAGDPPPDLVWHFNSRPLEASERRYALAASTAGLVRWLNVTIVQVRAGDRGGYACLAENAAGRDERNVTFAAGGRRRAARVVVRGARPRRRRRQAAAEGGGGRAGGERGRAGGGRGLRAGQGRGEPGCEASAAGRASASADPRPRRRPDRVVRAQPHFARSRFFPSFNGGAHSAGGRAARPAHVPSARRLRSSLPVTARAGGGGAGRSRRGARAVARARQPARAYVARAAAAARAAGDVGGAAAGAPLPPPLGRLALLRRRRLLPRVRARESDASLINITRRPVAIIR